MLICPFCDKYLV